MDLAADKRGFLAPGTMLSGTYEIVRPVGEGGMGELYEARHTRLAGRYAVKFLRKEIAALGSMAFQRFQREAEITSSLRHPHIVQVIDFNQGPDGAPFIVMEFLEGTSLAARIEQGPMKLAQVVPLVEQIASALEAAHGRGVVHRDLKPHNLFVVPAPGPSGEFAKVLDFGISKVKTGDSLTGEFTLVGTPHYMSPEQARGAGDEVDGRTDQFALAAIVYEMVSGRVAFPGDSVPAVLYGVVHQDPPPLMSAVGPEVDAVLRRGMAKEKEARYPTIMAFAADLRAAAIHQLRGSGELADRELGRPSRGGTTRDLPADGATPVVDLRRTPFAAPAPRSSRRALGVVIALAAAAGVGGLALWRWGRPGSGRQPPRSAAVAERGAAARLRVERALEFQRAALRAAARQAAGIPQLYNAARSGVDAFTFKDLFQQEDWWRPYLDFACAVLDGDRLMVARGADELTDATAWLEVAGPPGSDGSAGVLGARYLAAGARFGGAGRFAVVLARPLTAAWLGELEAKVGTPLLVSDGKRALAVGKPAGLETLVGREGEGGVYEAAGQGAVATRLGPQLWVWTAVPSDLQSASTTN